MRSAWSVIYYIFQYVSGINEGFVVRAVAPSWHVPAQVGQPETNRGSISDAISSFDAAFFGGGEAPKKLQKCEQAKKMDRFSQE